MGPLIILLAIGIAMAALVWRSRSVPARRSAPARRDARGDGNDGTFYDSGAYGRGGKVSCGHAGGDSTVNSATFYDTSVYDGGAEVSTGHADTHCSDSGAGFSGDCSSDGGGSSGD